MKHYYCNCCRVPMQRGGDCEKCKALKRQIFAAHHGDGYGPEVAGQATRVERYRELAEDKLPLFGGAR